jgi:DNA-binding Xre family transcriptional regulator
VEGLSGTTTPKQAHIPHTECSFGQIVSVAGKLERQLATFLRERRGGMTYAQFSNKVGLPPSTLHRLEMCQQSITLSRLELILKRLKCRVREIFPE